MAVSSSHSLDMEKKAGSQDASLGDLHDAPATPKSRRSILPWLACLALALLIFAGGRTEGCDRLSASHRELPVSNVGVHKDGPSGLTRGKHLGVEPPPVAKRQASPTSPAAASPTVLECFQVAPPVLTPDGATDSDGSHSTGGSAAKESCTVLLMKHSFGYSYGMPFIGKFDHVYGSQIQPSFRLPLFAPSASGHLHVQVKTSDLHPVQALIPLQAAPLTE